MPKNISIRTSSTIRPTPSAPDLQAEELHAGLYHRAGAQPDYWKKGLPYLDGIKYFIITDTSARAKALRSGRVDIELRNLPPADVDGITAQLGDKVVVANSNHQQLGRSHQCG